MINLYTKISEMGSRTITREYSTSFSIAVSLLAPEIRQAVYNIYGFVRVADEIVDTFHDFPQEELLNRFEEDYRHAIKTGISSNPVLQAFQHSVNEYHIDIELIEAFMKSMRADLSKEDYETPEEIAEYIYGSADVVGLMCLKVFVKGNQEEYDKLKASAMKLGSAFQKVNFLRDIHHDFNALNRSYFPNVNPEKMTEEDKKSIVNDIETEFSEALVGIKQLPKRARFGVYVAYNYFYLLLKKINDTSAEVIMAKRIRVSNFRKITLLVKSYLVNKLNLM